MANGEFYVGEWRCARDENEKAVHGNIYLHTHDFLAVGGYSECVKSYGWDDSDFTIRLMLSGLTKRLINQDLCYHVPHGHALRTKNLHQYVHPMVLTLTHRICFQKIPFWTSKQNMTNYTVNKVRSNYYECVRLHEPETENIIDSVVYENSMQEAYVTVFDWYKDQSNSEHKRMLREKDLDKIKEYLTELILTQ